MADIKFDNGVMKTSNRETAIALSFMPACAECDLNLAVLKSLPRLHGLKRKSHRMAYAFDFISELHKLGYEIKKRETV